MVKACLQIVCAPAFVCSGVLKETRSVEAIHGKCFHPTMHMHNECDASMAVQLFLLIL